MNKTLVHSLIDKRYGRDQKLIALLLVGCRQGGPKLLDLRPQLTPVAPVDLIAFRILSNAFLC